MLYNGPVIFFRVSSTVIQSLTLTPILNDPYYFTGLKKMIISRQFVQTIDQSLPKSVHWIRIINSNMLIGLWTVRLSERLKPEIRGQWSMRAPRFCLKVVEFVVKLKVDFLDEAIYTVASKFLSVFDLEPLILRRMWVTCSHKLPWGLICCWQIRLIVRSIWPPTIEAIYIWTVNKIGHGLP